MLNTKALICFVEFDYVTSIKQLTIQAITVGNTVGSKSNIPCCACAQHLRRMWRANPAQMLHVCAEFACTIRRHSLCIMRSCAHLPREECATGGCYFWTPLYFPHVAEHCPQKRCHTNGQFHLTCYHWSISKSSSTVPCYRNCYDMSVSFADGNPAMWGRSVPRTKDMPTILYSVVNTVSVKLPHPKGHILITQLNEGHNYVMIAGRVRSGTRKEKGWNMITSTWPLSVGEMVPERKCDNNHTSSRFTWFEKVH
jgi:hypothetical protein